MAIAIQATATATGSGNDVTITKPTGTAEGDLLIAVITNHDDIGTPEAATGTGFTQIAAQTANDNDCGVTALYKVAGASEGSSYTFTCANGNRSPAGILFRIDGQSVNTGDIQSFTANDTGSGSTFSATGKSMTSLSGDTILIGVGVSAADSIDHTDFQVNGVTDPTWTARFTSSDANAGRSETWSADFDSTSTITGATVTRSGSGGDAGNGIIVVMIEAATNGSATADLISNEVTLYDPTGTGSSTVTADLLSIQATTYDPTGTGGANKFTNTTKNAATNVNNQTKN